MFGFPKFASFLATVAVLATSSTYAAPLDTEASTHVLEPRITHHGRATWFNVGLGECIVLNTLETRTDFPPSQVTAVDGRQTTNWLSPSRLPSMSETEEATAVSECKQDSM
jgi:hypothetical protein